MALAGDGVLAIWNGIAPEAEAEFLRWHVEEHIPERVAVPGFLRARRYVAVAGTPKYFNFYETQAVSDLAAPAYLDRLNAPSEWTKAVVRHFRQTSRTICRVRHSIGLGDGSHVATFRMATALAPEAFGARALAEASEMLLRRPGLVAAHLLEGEIGGDGAPTAEKALRQRPDERAAWIFLVEAVEPGPLEDVLGDGGDAFLQSIDGVCAVTERGLYRLQYGLARAQLDERR